jgi:K+-transporting ATPase KdpF subunit
LGLRESLTKPPHYLFMENLIVGLISFALMIYLIVTIIRPEKF